VLNNKIMDIIVHCVFLNIILINDIIHGDIINEYSDHNIHYNLIADVRHQVCLSQNKCFIGEDKDAYVGDLSAPPPVIVGVNNANKRGSEIAMDKTSFHFDNMWLINAIHSVLHICTFIVPV